MCALSVGMMLGVTVATLSAGASAGEARRPGPICRTPSVLDEMAREVRLQDHYARIEPRLVDEYPGVAPNTVLCGVAVHTLRYDDPYGRDWPLWICMAHQFRVRAVLSGYVVTFLR